MSLSIFYEADSKYTGIEFQQTFGGCILLLLEYNQIEAPVVAQLVEYLTLNFRLGQDLRVLGSSPCWALHSVESQLEFLSLPLPLTLLLLALSFSKIYIYIDR